MDSVIDKPAGSVINSRGQTYYFHEKVNPKNKVKFRYFSKSAEGKVAIPEELDIVENPKTGLPFAKKRK